MKRNKLLDKKDIKGEEYKMKRLSKEEIESCSFMTNILENMQDMVRVLDKNGKVVFMNKIMREKYGDLIGKKCYEAINKTQKCEECITEKSLKFLEAYKKEEKVNENVYSVVSSPVLNPVNNQYFSVEVFRDITEQKKLEKQIMEQYNKMKSDLSFAKHLQTKIIPKDNVYGENIKVTSKYVPSEFLGGDIYDIFEIDEENIGIYIADVSGHGVSASMFTMFLRQVMRNKQNKALSIEETINDLIKSYKELKIDPETYFTVMYGIYNKRLKEIVFVNAGHNCYPIIIRQNEKIEEIEVKGFPICSIVDKFSHNSIKITLNKGDKVLLYTDGIVEAYNRETKMFFGYERLFNVLNQNINQERETIVSKIYEEVIDFSSGRIKDDIALVLLEII